MEEKTEKMRGLIEFTDKTIETLTSIREELYSLKKIEWKKSLKEIIDDLIGDTLMVFIGEFSSGKSTFINALLGTNLLPTASKPCTCVVTEVELVSDGYGHRGKIFYLDNKGSEEMIFEDLIKLIDGNTADLGKMAFIHHVELKYDISLLGEDSPLKIMEQAKVKLVDTPGFNSPYGMNEDVVMEYLEKSKYSFWLFSSDRIGGSVAKNMITNIKRKGIEIIPIITKSDRINEERKEELREKFSEYFSSSFIMKEPRFVSAYKAIEAFEISKKSSIHNPDLNDKIAKLNQESGLEAVARDLFKRSTENVITERRINAAGGNLGILITILKKHLKDEYTYWEKSLHQKGWTEDDNYKKLSETFRTLENYSINEAKSIAKEFEVALCDRVLRILSSNKAPSVINEEINNILQRLKFEIIKERLGKTHKYIGEKFKTDIEPLIHGDSLEITPPDLSNFQNLLNVVLSFFDSLRYAGPTSLANGAIGTGLMVSLPAIAKIPLIGASIQLVAGFLGVGLLVFAIVPLIPAIVDSNRNQREKARLKLGILIRDWTNTVKIEYVIKKSIDDMINNYHKMLKDKMDRDTEVERLNHETAKNAYNDLCDKEQEFKTVFSIK